MAAHPSPQLASSRPRRRDRDRNRASAASVLLVLRGDGMADASATARGAPEELPTDAKAAQSQPQPRGPREDEQEARPRFVHEVTESSSDESADESADEEGPAGGQSAPPTANRTVIPTSPEMDADHTHAPNDGKDGAEEPQPQPQGQQQQQQPQPQQRGRLAEREVVVQEYFPTRNVADMHYLFTNDRLKEQPATVVLRSDPFCIPRVTDNVSEYRPRFNALSILEAEEKLLPGYFRLDPTEGVPGATDGSSSVLLPLPSAAAAAAGSTAALAGKSTAFMGSMPRQQEFVEFPISDNIFHSFKAAPPPASPRPGRFASKLHHGLPPGSSSAPTDFDAAAGPDSPAALADAVLLSSMQHAPDAVGAVGASTEPLYSPPTPTPTPPLPADGLLQAHLPPSAATDALASYLPARPFDPPAHGDYFLDDVAGGGYALEASSAIPSLFVDDGDAAASAADPAAATATTPQPDPKARASLQPVSKKPRAKNAFRQCSAPGCVKGARGKSGLCQRHGGGRRCAAPGCPKGAQGSSAMCLFHGGGYRCTVAGCVTGARGTSGLCAKHGGYKRAKGAGGSEDGRSPSAKRPRPS